MTQPPGYQPPPGGPGYDGHPPYGYPPPVQGLGDLSRPLYDASIGQAVGRFWRKYAHFSGRASPSEYWWWYLVSVLASVVLTSINYAIVGYEVVPYRPGQDFRDYVLQSLRSSLVRSVGSLAWSLVTMVGQIAISVRRLHDTGRSGWWYLLTFVPLVGAIVLIVFWALPPNPEGRRFDQERPFRRS